MAQNFEVTLFPWLAPGDRPPVESGYTRRTLVVSREFQEASIDVCDDRLPETGRWVDQQGKWWRRFELPCADWSDDAAPLAAMVSLSSAGLTTQQFPVSQAGALPRPSRIRRGDEGLDHEAAEFPPSRLAPLAAALESVTDNHVEFVNDLWDSVRPHRHYWAENVQGAALRSLQRARARWRRSGQRDEARLALIVKLAAKLPRVLEQVCLQPRVVLRRVRKMIGVSRVQETDASCLRWLARQPGRSVVEKAGSRQQVLGIVRVEDADTPENRVVRDLLLRALVECRRYLAENRRFPNHPRVLAVRQFRSQMNGLLRDSPVGRVGALVGEAKPNYVLQHEARYAVLWEAYLLLVRQQKLQEDIWRWRERTWTEVCQLALWDGLRRLRFRGSAWRSDVLCRDQQSAGRFLDEACAIAAWERPDGAVRLRVEMATGPQVARRTEVPAAVRPLSPDLVLIPNGRGELPLLLVWTLFGDLTAQESLNFALERLGLSLRKLNAQRPVRALLLTPEPSCPAPPPIPRDDGIELVRLPLPAPDAHTAILDALERCWGIQ